MAYHHTDVLDKQIKALPTIGEASGSVASFETDMTENLIDVVCDIQYSQASGTPTPSTPIPIQTFSEMNVYATGKNLVSDTITGYIVNSNGVITSSGNINSIAIAPVKSGKTYTITTDDSTGFVGGFFTSKPIIGSTTYNGSRTISSNKTFTAPIDGWVAFRTSYEYSTPQCELGNEATSYEAYNGNTYNIPFGQTVAKGTLNVTTGVLEITWGVIDLGSLSWSTDGQGYAQAVLSDIKPTPTTTDIAPIKCDKLLPDTQAHVYAKTTDNTVSGASSAQVRVYMTSLVGLNNTQVKSALEGFILVYELATPQVIQLSATQITALLNENNIWCDTNGDTSVKYVLSVGKKIA